MDRNIFKFNDGCADCHVDPLVIHRELNKATGGEFNELLKRAQDKNPQVWMPALEKVLLAARHAFALPPIDRETGNGFGESIVDRVIWEFLDFLEKKNQTPATPPISPAPSGGNAPPSC